MKKIECRQCNGVGGSYRKVCVNCLGSGIEHVIDAEYERLYELEKDLKVYFKHGVSDADPELKPEASVNDILDNWLGFYIKSVENV